MIWFHAGLEGSLWEAGSLGDMGQKYIWDRIINTSG